ncbi:hypothetical protein B5807_02964 [Epicoccum nigrum]|uniref:Uncharacterized protein n=1 Tax=Epicoccum nigrum TaxID=105696 RepID=A0A1Y2MAX0_EPING|nr:hypothetical protein B5807_02964 [Epicoccum nigrum]
MIDALRVDRFTEDAMSIAWKRGEQAASGLKLVGQSDGLYEDGGEVYYVVDGHDRANLKKKFPQHIGMLALQGFPVSTQAIYEGIESILVLEPSESPTWLLSHIEVNYLLRAEIAPEELDKKFASVFLKYQALLFGFYYQLLRNVLSFDLTEPSAFFHGIWGTRSTTFLAMCTQLGCSLRRSERASRAHVLYVLAAMYSGRRKVFKPESPIPRLVGVIGPISVLAMPLVRTTDNPEEISKIAVVDLPIADLSADTNEGDLMASDGGGIAFVLARHAGRDLEDIKITDPKAKWVVSPHMAVALESGSTSGVVMAARCGTRLVGWFNPLAADMAFLGPAYLKEWRSEIDRDAKRTGFEVRDEDWQSGRVPRPDPGSDGYGFGVVQSHNSPTLRYAASGFYGELGEEVVIARSADEFYGAFDRTEAQGQGILIT